MLTGRVRASVEDEGVHICTVERPRSHCPILFRGIYPVVFAHIYNDRRRSIYVRLAFVSIDAPPAERWRWWRVWAAPPPLRKRRAERRRIQTAPGLCTRPLSLAGPCYG